MRAAVISVLLILFSAPLAATPDSINRYFIEAARAVKGSVVNIVVYEKVFKGGALDYKKIAYGSGTIISSDGLVVTNYHVIKKGSHYNIIDSEGSVYEIDKIKGRDYFLADSKTDLAVLKIKNSGGAVFEPARFSDSSALEEGEWVIAIGNPYGLKQSITAGIVSSKGRDSIGFADIEDFIQTDVSINPGNSGGPLVNLKGEVVGINTAIRTSSGGYQGISFAIPSNIAKAVCDELITYGRVRRGWLGFLVSDKKSSSSGKGEVRVISVVKGSPAERAGLLNGDIIKSIDSEPVTSVGMLLKTVAGRQIDSVVRLAVIRDGELREYRLVLREKQTYREIKEGIENLFSEYGIEIDENSESGGVVVTYVSPESRRYGIRSGDTIISVNGIRAPRVDIFLSAVHRKRIRVVEILRDSVIYEITLD